MIRVNGELINPNLIEDAFTRIKSEEETRTQASCCERNVEFEKAAEEEVVDSVLVAQEAERTHPTIPEEEITAGLEDLIKLYREHGASWDMLEAERDHLREEVTANLRMERFMKERVPEVEEPGEDELLQYYESSKKSYRSLPEAHCIHLLKQTDRSEDHRELLDEMTALRRRIRAGEDFDTIAKAETEKESKEIDLGWIPLDRPTNPFEAILFSLEEGEVSPVISYDHALHLVKVIARRGGEAPSLEELRAELANNYVVEKRQAALRELAATLRKTATIEHVDMSAERD